MNTSTLQELLAIMRASGACECILEYQDIKLSASFLPREDPTRTPEPKPEVFVRPRFK